MKARRRLKVAAGVMGALLALALIFALTLPFWLGTALGPVLAHYGVQFGKFERVGYTRFIVRDLHTSTGKFDLRVAKAEGFMPYAWYRLVRKQGTNTAPSFLAVNGWTLTLKKTPKKDHGPEDVYPLFKKAEAKLALGRKWLPKALLLNGVVQAQEKAYTFSTITWDRGKLDVDGIWPETQVPLELKANLSGVMPYQISYVMSPIDIRLRLQLAETNNGLGAKLLAIWKENRADVTAQFGRTGMLPETADLKARDFQIPAEMLKLKGYEKVTGNLSATWRTNHFALKMQGHGEPSGGTRQFPALDINVRAGGDTNFVNLEQLTVTGEGLDAALLQPVEISIKGQIVSSNAQLRFNADTEKLAFKGVSGTLEGRIDAAPSTTRFPSVVIEAKGQNFVANKIRAEQLNISGKVIWPVLTNLALNMQLATNSNLSLTGAADLERREIFGANLKLSGPLPPSLLSSNISLADITLTAEAKGVITQLTHSATLSINHLEAPQLAPLNLDAQWRGQMLKLDDLRLRARAGPASLSLAGSGGSSEGSTNLVVRELTLSKGDEQYLALAKPFTISVSGGNEKGRSPEVKLQTLDWRGDKRSLNLAFDASWPESARVQFAATNINPDLFQFFVKRSLSGIDMPHLQSDLRWNGETVSGSLSGAFSVEHSTFKRISAEVGIEARENEIAISELELATGAGQVLTARGSVPIRLHPRATNKLEIIPDQEVDFSARSSRNPEFWDILAEKIKMRLTEPQVDLAVKGTMKKPKAELSMSASSLQLLRTNRELPAIENLQANLSLNEQALAIKSFSLEVERQPIRATGQVGLGEEFWSKPREQLEKYILDHSDVRVEASKLAVAPFIRFFPKYARPEGYIEVNLALKPGRQLAGGFSLSNLATRSLPNIGTIESINADVRVKGREVEVGTINAIIGGERLNIAGNIDLSEDKMKDGYPAIRLTIKGTNVPLARTPDIIMRSDLNLVVSNERTNVPVVAGVVNLRDSFLMRDITTLAPGHVTKPSRRPPYFSIETDPVSQWLVDVRVRGNDFLRVNSPFFQGAISADFKVQGTTREPFASGEARITSGLVLFPFANLNVKQGVVSLTVDNPYMPQIYVVATARTFGYDITMEAEGPAKEPVVKFSSIPALTSEQIVLMLTTGELPRQDFAFSNEQRAGRLAVFLGKSLWSKFRGGEGGAERLTIKSGEDISEQGKQTYSVEYKLTDRWSLVGEYDRWGDLNAGVKWKLYSR